MVPDHLKQFVNEYEITPMEEVSSFIQAELIKGLAKNGSQISVFNKLHIREYPKGFKKIFITDDDMTCENNVKIDSLPFLNIPVLSKISWYNSLKSRIKHWVDLNGNNETVVICYACTWYNLRILEKIKKKNNNVVTSIIIPDLPEYMYAGRKKGLKYLLRRCYLDYMNHLLKNTKKDIDMYILFSDLMADYIGCRDKYVVMEGVAKESSNIPFIPDSQRCKKRLYYGGGITEEYGVRDLVDAFLMIENTNIELVLCGSGNAEEYVKKMAERDNRIKYLGYVSYDVAQRTLLEADIVINPRKDSIYEFTKYSFPSKILDTLSLGKPLISYKLEGIPSEYDDYILYVEDHNIDTLRRKIEEVCAWDNERLFLFGKNAQSFVKSNKTGFAQSNKILKAIKMRALDRA